MTHHHHPQKPPTPTQQSRNPHRWMNHKKKGRTNSGNAAEAAYQGHAAGYTDHASWPGPCETPDAARFTPGVDQSHTGQAVTTK